MVTMRAVEAETNLTMSVDGEVVAFLPGQTVAAALLAAGRRTFRSAPDGSPRGVFCGMGVCFECLVTIDGTADQRACLTPASPGMCISLGSGRRGDLDEQR